MRIIEALAPDQAKRALVEAWWGGKNASQPRTPLNPTGNDDGSGWVLAEVELHLVRPNEEPGRYDATVDPVRANAYASTNIEVPVHLLFGERAVRHGARCAAVMDGGHRVTAARIRGVPFIRAVMQRADYVRLQQVSQSHQTAMDLVDVDDLAEGGEAAAWLHRQAMR